MGPHTTGRSSAGISRLPRSNNGSVDSPKNPSAATTNPATTSHFGKTPVLAT